MGEIMGRGVARTGKKPEAAQQVGSRVEHEILLVMDKYDPLEVPDGAVLGGGSSELMSLQREPER
jgi:hypothetical protein